MPRVGTRIAALAGAALVASLIAASSASAVELIKDPSFEASTAATNQGGNSPNWVEADSAFLGNSPLCTVGAPSNCGTGGGTAGPRTGIWWAWFGGVTTTQTSSAEQTVTIPRGKATLTFFARIVGGVAAGDETFNATIDGSSLFSAVRATGGFSTYAPVTRDVSAFANGLPHTLRFSFSNPTPNGGGASDVANISIDDVSLLSTPPPKKCKKKKGKKGASAAKKKCKKKKKK
jgi:hypothetical protein